MKKRIKGFKEYKIDEFGNVFSYKYKKERILKPYIYRGYKYVNIMKNNKRDSFTIHRLVARTFINNKDNLPCVDHIDCNKSNNYFKNLRWVTVKQNSFYAKKNGLLKIVNKRPVLELDRTTNKIINKFESGLDAERKTGINNEQINRVCNNKQKYTHGRLFVFE